MFNFLFKTHSASRTAFCISDYSYSVVTLAADNTILTKAYRTFTPETLPTMAKTLAEDAENLDLIGQKSLMVLCPNQYQLVMVDAVDVPEQNMAKALKWQLKGLIDYPLNDIALDAFLVPPHGVAKQQKKAFVAVTPLSKLRTKLALFEAAYIDISEVSIAELTLQAICTRMSNPKQAPLIVLSLNEETCQLQIFYQELLYLVRPLQVPLAASENDPAAVKNILLEIQRSMDYCLTTLKIPEPQQILFTPGFHQYPHVVEFIRNEQLKPVTIIDLNSIITFSQPLDFNEQHALFYSIGAAMGPLIPGVALTNDSLTTEEQPFEH